MAIWGARAVQGVLVCGWLLMGAMPALAASFQAEPPVTTDSRIKTFVYNPNEVFTITTHYGYQSNIEFGEKEIIDTVSVGDRVAWQLIPSGRRIFIRAMEENAHTNMTIVTNLRAYQFDLRSSSADAVFGSEELTYVVRFFYPELNATAVPAALSNMPVPAMPSAPATPSMPLPAAAPSPIAFPPAAVPAAAAPVPATPTPPAPPTPTASKGLNYQYTYAGTAALAPLKIYDDGRSTYFKFSDARLREVALITAAGERLPLTVRTLADGMQAVDAIAARFEIRLPEGEVTVYNESNGAAS